MIGISYETHHISNVEKSYRNSNTFKHFPTFNKLFIFLTHQTEAYLGNIID